MAQELSAPVVIKGSGGKTIFLFQSDLQIILQGTQAKPTGLFLGTSKADGGGREGKVFLFNTSGNEGVALKGNGTLVMRDQAGKVVFNFDPSEANIAGKPAGLWLGRAKGDGGGPSLLVMRNAAGEDGIVLDASNGFIMRDHEGKVVFNFASEANIPGKPAGLWLGRWKGDGGGASLLVMRNAAGEDGIVLDGNNGLIMRDQAGKVVFNFAAEAGMTGKPAGLWLGRAREDGGGASLLVMRDAAGADSIVLDGKAGDIHFPNADCAEEFDIAEAEEVEPGTVMVLDQEGQLQKSKEAYDKKVAGVISGAGGYKPAIILGRQCSQHNRMPVALVGKAYCKVDAQYAPIEVGALLTTSSTAGHAMKVDDPQKAFGAVLGKALRPLQRGRGLIPILIALQ
jgi:hypothetical protein